MKIVCSRCRAILPSGSEYCPECRRAPAEETVVPPAESVWIQTFTSAPVRTRAHLPLILAVLVIATGATGSGIGYSFLHRLNPRSPREIFAAEVQNGRLATPEAFEAHCGLPAQVEHIGERTILHYAPGDRRVSFAPGKPVDLGEASHHPERAYEWLHCDGQF